MTVAPTRQTLPSLLVVVNDLRPYGSQRVALSLVGEWVRAGSAVTLATLEEPSDDDLPVPDGVVVHRLRRSGSRAWALTSLARQVRHLVLAEEPSRVVSHMTLSNVVVLRALRKKRPVPPPVLVVEHNTLSRSLGTHRGAKVMARLVRAWYPRAAAVVGVSDGVVDDLRESFGVPPERMRRIYNPVPRRGTVGGAHLHPWLAPDRAHVTLVCVGGLRMRKGQDMLLRAIASMDATQRSRVRLVLLGEGPEEQALADLALELGVAPTVLMAGYRDDAPAWVAAADVLVMPSRSDSFGLVAVEAARAGTPVVATAVPGLREIVPDYAAGWLVPPEDPEELGRLIATFRRPVTAPPATGDLAEFDPEAAARRYALLLEEIGR